VEAEVASTAKRRRQSRWDSGPAQASTDTARAGADVDECGGGASDNFSGGGPSKPAVVPSAKIANAASLTETPEEGSVTAAAAAAAVAAAPAAGGTAAATATSPISAASPKRVYVGNLSYRLTELDVRSLFAFVGDIQQVSMPVDPLLGRHRGFAFLEFSSAAAAQNALRMDGLLVADR